MAHTKLLELALVLLELRTSYVNTHAHEVCEGMIELALNTARALQALHHQRLTKG